MRTWTLARWGLVRARDTNQHQPGLRPRKKGQGRDDIICHHCGEPGHIQPNCPKKKAHDAAEKEKKDEGEGK